LVDISYFLGISPEFIENMSPKDFDLFMKSIVKQEKLYNIIASRINPDMLDGDSNSIDMNSNDPSAKLNAYQDKLNK